MFKSNAERVLSLEAMGIIVFCSIVQNIFGVGILVFGTPILLALEYDLLYSLGILLPSSFAVSLIQILTTKNTTLPNFKTLFWSVVGVVGGVFLLQFFSVVVLVYGITAFAMLFAGLLRLNERFRAKIEKILNYRYLNFFLLTGIFHGFSNLGGILLVLKNSVGTQTRNQSLINTATVYLLYVVSQITVLSFSGKSAIFLDGFLIAPIAGLVSYWLGQRPLSSLSNRQMDLSLGFFFLLVGLVLTYKTIQFYR